MEAGQGLGTPQREASGNAGGAGRGSAAARQWRVAATCAEGVDHGDACGARQLAGYYGGLVESAAQALGPVHGHGHQDIDAAEVAARGHAGGKLTGQQGDDVGAAAKLAPAQQGGEGRPVGVCEPCDYGGHGHATVEPLEPQAMARQRALGHLRQARQAQAALAAHQ